MSRMELTGGAERIITLLEGAGYECYVVGGCVRDWLLKRPGHDVDLATDALCSDVHRLLEAEGIGVFDTGVEHGTVTAAVAHETIEITTFRVDGTYSDRRHPDSVRFTTSIAADLGRRDFTVNAMAYNPTRGLIDPFGGQEDLDRRLIRCVGDPAARFEEDALRILRAVRFASQLAFTIESDTKAALCERATSLEDVSAERVAKELLDFVCGADIHRALIEYTDIIGVVLPEILPMKGFDQHNPYHVYDTLEHTAVAMASIAPQPVLRMTMLLHDIGKPSTYFMDEQGRGHCYGHPKESARIAEEVLARLRYSSEFSQRVVTLVANHDAGLKATRRNVRRWMNRLGPDTLRDLLAVKRADVSALAPAAHEWLPLFDDVEYLEDELLSEHACFTLKSLAVNGDDLKEIGMQPGPQMGRTLDALLDLVLDEEVGNEREPLLAKAREMLQRS